jgi:Domain of unknown function (DUF4157)
VNNRDRQGRRDQESSSSEASSVAPGKRIRTDGLQRKAAVGASGPPARVVTSSTRETGDALPIPAAAASRSPAASGGDLRSSDQSFLDGIHFGPIQCRASGEEMAQGSAQAIAAHGFTGAAQPLPFQQQIQASFGRHSVAGIEAHVGTAATVASHQLGAHAYAMGNSIAFGGAPDLHTAAHESAHVIQQRAGLHLKDGIGEAGDMHERHADAVADLVVQEKSAALLLDQYGGGASTTGAPVQCSGADAGAQQQQSGADAGVEHQQHGADAGAQQQQPAGGSAPQQPAASGATPACFMGQVPVVLSVAAGTLPTPNQSMTVAQLRALAATKGLTYPHLLAFTEYAIQPAFHATSQHGPLFIEYRISFPRTFIGSELLNGSVAYQRLRQHEGEHVTRWTAAFEAAYAAIVCPALTSFHAIPTQAHLYQALSSVLPALQQILNASTTLWDNEDYPQIHNDLQGQSLPP